MSESEERQAAQGKLTRLAGQTRHARRRYRVYRERLLGSRFNRPEKLRKLRRAADVAGAQEARARTDDRG